MQTVAIFMQGGPFRVKLCKAVVKVHNDFWVQVKLKSGNYEGFAPNGRNYKDKAFMDRLKALQPGDTVTVQFTTDSERHRIVAFKKK